jgi:chemotaxis protein methyltransferase CheR
MSINLGEKLTPDQFEMYKKLIKSDLGIKITEAKMDMLQGKLFKLIKKAGCSHCYDEYYKLITSNNKVNDYWESFVDVITVHKTHFFREDDHFKFIRSKIDEILAKNPQILRQKEIKVWCSACSTGDEAYTIAMVLRESLGTDVDIKILATDISEKVLLDAQRGQYSLDEEDAVSPYYLSKYFVQNEDGYQVTDEIKNFIRFRKFNLMNDFNFKTTFDIIFCRNVMIYFDDKTQEELINKFYNVIAKGGLLFIGHSESINIKQHNFKYLYPTIYSKI